MRGREYRFLDVEKLKDLPLTPVEGTVEEVLTDALLDIIQLAEAEGMAEAAVDRVLAGIVSLRAMPVFKILPGADAG